MALYEALPDALDGALTEPQDALAWLTQEIAYADARGAQPGYDVVLRLSRAAECRDPGTGSHIVRMASYCRLIAARLGLSLDQQDLLQQAAPMHDIGKVAVSEHILLKPAALTPAEFEDMKQHALLGYELLKNSTLQVLQVGAEIAKGHHEKFDGSGYPYGLAGESIPIFSRIVAVADVFDALTSDRPYKKAWSLREAADFLRHGSGTHFDPACVQAFLSGWDEVNALLIPAI